MSACHAIVVREWQSASWTLLVARNFGLKVTLSAAPMKNNASLASTSFQINAEKNPSLWMLSVITLIASMSMHIFVPALPAVAEKFGSSAALAQLTLTAYIVGMGAGQLIYGPLSDRYGRRPVLMCGMVMFTLASLVSLVSPTIGILIVARLVEGLGAGAGLVLGRAIVRDCHAGEQATRMLSLLNLFLLMAPGFSPLVGSMLSQTIGWRSIFAVLSLVGCLNLVIIFFMLRETRHDLEPSFRAVLADYGVLVRSANFLRYSIAGGCTANSIYAFIGASPFVFVHQLHRPFHEIGIYLAINIAGMALGSFFTRTFVGRIPSARLLKYGNLLSCIGIAAFCVTAIAGQLAVWNVLATILAFTIGAGMVSPITLSRALNVNPHVAGSSSGFYGFSQQIIGAACTALATIGSNPALAAGLTMLAAVLIAQLCIAKSESHAVR